MMSKNSFLVSMKENLKRRNWVAVCSFLSLFFYFPICLAMMLQNATRRTAEYGIVVSLQEVSERMLSIGDGIPLVIAFFIAIFSAIQGFSYLYHTKKVDFYHSVPVSKKKRFFTIYLNGILLYVIPYLINLLLGILVALVYHGFSIEILPIILIGFIINLLFYLCIYHISILAVMLTGNLVVTCFAAIVFFLYEILVKYLISGFKGIFFGNSYIFRALPKTWFSPFALISEYFPEINFRWEDMASLLIGLLWVAIVWGIAAYIAYYFRPSEASKKAMAYEKSKVIVKIALMIPISLYSGVLFSEFSSSNHAFAVFGFFAGLLLSHAVIESIYEFDIKAAFSRKRQIVYGGLFAGVFFVIFYFDIFGYDSYVPKKEKVESVGIFFNDYRQDFRDEDGNYINTIEYQLENVEVNDTEPILLLAEKGKEYAKQDGTDRITVCYNLKNGKKVYRKIPVNMEDAETLQILNNLYTNEEYKKQAYQIYSDEKFKNTKEIKLYVGNGSSNLPVDDSKKEKFLEIYKKEFLALNYEERYQALPSAELSIVYVIESGEKDSPHYYEMSFSTDYPIYASFEDTMKFLTSEGLYQEPKPAAENITAITVNFETNAPYETYQEARFAARISLMETKESIFIEDKKDIAQIVPYLYSGELADYRIKPEITYLSAEVGLKTGENGIRYGDYDKSTSVYEYYIFENGEMPEFLKEKMK